MQIHPLSIKPSGRLKICEKLNVGNSILIWCKFERSTYNI